MKAAVPKGIPRAVAVREKPRRQWYVVDGLHYLGPYDTSRQAAGVRKALWTDASGCARGRVELLDAEAPTPTFGLHGPLKPRFE